MVPEPGVDSRRARSHLELHSWPETIGGRPGLAEVGRQLEEALKAINALPDEIADPDGRPITDVADEVRELLSPKITTATLGRTDLYIGQLFWGLPQGISDRRCASLAFRGPSFENWGNVNWRHLYITARLERARLRAHVSDCARLAILEVYGLPQKDREFNPERPQPRGKVEIAWPGQEVEVDG